MGVKNNASGESTFVIDNRNETGSICTDANVFVESSPLSFFYKTQCKHGRQHQFVVLISERQVIFVYVSEVPKMSSRHEQQQPKMSNGACEKGRVIDDISTDIFTYAFIVSLHFLIQLGKARLDVVGQSIGGGILLPRSL